MANQKTEAIDISLIEKLASGPTLIRSLLAAVTRAVTGPLLGGPRANTYFKDVIFAALRTNLSLITIKQESWFTGTTEAQYLEWAKKQSVQPDTDVLGSGTKIHWLGPKTAKKVVVYYHGGGFALSCTPGHFQWLFDLQNDLAKDHSISIVVVSYTLTPGGKYPLQVQQSVEALSHVLDQGKKPEDIFIGGDSAGGNLTLSVLSHLLHPHPKLPERLRLRLSSPLAGALLISPWVKFNGKEDSSFKRNFYSDMLAAEGADRWGNGYLGSAPLDNWNQPVLADDAWFRQLPSVTSSIFVWGGGGEVLIDSIELIAAKLKKAHPRTEVVVQPGAAHEDFIFDKILGYTAKAQGTEVIERWMRANL